MKIYHGKSVLQAIAIGKVFVYRPLQPQIPQYKVEQTAPELARLKQALELAKEELQQLYTKARQEVGEEHAEIFEIHQMMLEDEDYLDSITGMIEEQRLNAEAAVGATGEAFAAMFAAMEDEYMKARAADVGDISARVIRCFSSRQQAQQTITEPVLVFAKDLMPSETVQLDKDKVLGFVTCLGSANSHTAILARTMNIPAIVGAAVPLEELENGTLAIVDGYSGEITLNPDDETLAKARKKLEQQQERKRWMKQMKGQETVTAKGKKIKLYANIGGSRDVAAVLENDGEGIGLFRSEFLYLEKEDYPTEQEQFEAYKQVLQAMGDKPVIVRTLDIGADKQVGYFGLEKEENPALGLRAIRICLTRPEIFKTQLRALYRASAFGNLAIMFPMIISVEEVLQCKAMAKRVQEQLRQEGVPFAPKVGLGIMIETPAAVFISDQLAKEVDFFSIGTNDLSQYILAIDRQNATLDSFFNPYHPAILAAIEMVAQNAHKNGIWVGVCGELAADPTIVETLLRLGVDELSVSPSFLLPTRKRIREV